MIDLTTDKTIIGPWVAKQVSLVWGPEGRECVGLVEGDRVLAGCIYEDYTGQSIRVHVAVDNPHVPLRKFIVTAFTYPFITLGVKKLVGFVPTNNKGALAFDLKLGFKPEAILKDIYPDGDMMIMSMLRKECRWIPAEHRKAA